MRLYGLTPEQLGAILRLAADNQNFEDAPPDETPMLRVIEGGRMSDGRIKQVVPGDHLRGKIAVSG